MKNTATTFNKYYNAIERNSVDGTTNTRRNQGAKSQTDPHLTTEDFNNGRIAKRLGGGKKSSVGDGRFNEQVVANNQFIAQKTRNNYAGFQKGVIDNELPMSFLPQTQPYKRKVNYDLGGRAWNDSAGYTMFKDNLTELKTPILNTEWKKSSGIMNSITQTNPFPITLNPRVAKSLFNNGAPYSSK